MPDQLVALTIAVFGALSLAANNTFDRLRKSRAHKLEAQEHADALEKKRIEDRHNELEDRFATLNTQTTLALTNIGSGLDKLSTQLQHFGTLAEKERIETREERRDIFQRLNALEISNAEIRAAVLTRGDHRVHGERS